MTLHTIVIKTLSHGRQGFLYHLWMRKVIKEYMKDIGMEAEFLETFGELE